MTLTNCLVDSNFASSWGGGIFLDNSSNNPPDETVLTIQDSVISNNITEESISNSGAEDCIRTTQQCIYTIPYSRTMPLMALMMGAAVST